MPRPKRFKLLSIRLHGGLGDHTAIARVRVDGDIVEKQATSVDGPITALYAAILGIAGRVEMDLGYFSIESKGSGADTVGIATIELDIGNKSFNSKGENVNIIFAAGLCLVSVLNNVEVGKLCHKIQRFQKPQIPIDSENISTQIQNPIITMENYSYTMAQGDGISTTASIQLKCFIEGTGLIERKCTGNGLISAGTHIISQLQPFRQLHPELSSWSVMGVSRGINDRGYSEVIIKGAEIEGRASYYQGCWEHSDIIHASLMAYLQAVGKFHVACQK
jgi:LeuA allosteric (dimerisation) domain